jgi:retinol dehydrogenase 12
MAATDMAATDRTGPDMTGRVCLVTGATRGIGRATAEALARMGATVIVHGRDAAAVDTVCRALARAQAAAGRNRGGIEAARVGSVSGVVADFSRLADVGRLADDVAARLDESGSRQLHVLVNNAGTGALRRRPTPDGNEWQFAVNHLAPFLLTNRLLDRIRGSAPARIVNVASRAHRRAQLDLDDVNWERRNYDAMRAYGASKLANILFTRELARRLAGAGVTANSLHPGVVATNIFNTMGVLGRVLGVLGKLWLLSPADGARTSIYLASSPEVADVSGRYLDKCRPIEPASSAQDDAAARRLWEISERMTGLSA